jgi:hypothetical protein
LGSPGVRVAPFHQTSGGVNVRAVLSALALVSFLGLATPALAEAGSGPSIYRALATARAFGVVGFKEIQFSDGKWEIEGRDPRGRTVNMHIDAVTGALLRMNRDY